MMYYRARYYDPTTGEFISRDPLGFVDGMSQYRAYFVPGNVDPSGNQQSVTQDDVATNSDYWQYTGAIPVQAWSKATATAEINTVISAMAAAGNNFGANLYKAFLSGGGVYTPSAADELEVKLKSQAWLAGVLEEYKRTAFVLYNVEPGCCRRWFDITLGSRHINRVRNAKWDRGSFDYPGVSSTGGGVYSSGYASDDNNLDLFLAYGGFGYNILGDAFLISTNGGSCQYRAEVTVTLDDKFSFAPKGIWGAPTSRLANRYYNAAHYLQEVDKSAGIVQHKLKYKAVVPLDFD